VLVEVHRAGIVESRHRGHVVQVGVNGDVESVVGDPDVEVTLRSTVKPFALVALLESGAADDLKLSREELALMAASHTGEDRHVRTLQSVFRRAGVSQSLLHCGPGIPSDRVTAARLARDGEDPGPMRHQCSGFHAASLLLARYAEWSLDDYADFDHPSQRAVRETVARLFGTTPAALTVGVDDCGLATYAFSLADVARAFVLLADPVAATAGDAERARSAGALTRVRDAMMAFPELVGGTEALDTVLMKRKPGALVSKGGAEGLRGIGLLPGARGAGRPAAGVAVRVEDGDGFARSNRAITVEALAQLDVLNQRELQALSPQHRPQTRGPDGSVAAQVIPGFQLAPVSELA
jgi:L-asparaginase II